MVRSLTDERFHLDHIRARSSGLETSDDAVVFHRPCWYLGAVLRITSGEDGYISIYDSPNSTLTGDKQVDELKAAGALDNKISVCHILEEPVWCSKGIFVACNQYQYMGWLVWYAY